MMNPKLNPDQWYEGRVVEVHPHWTWLRIQETVTGKHQVFILQPAYKAVNLEVTVESKKDVKFKLDSNMNVKEVERDGTTVRLG